jgi:hypothetical protein
MPRVHAVKGANLSQSLAAAGTRGFESIGFLSGCQRFLQLNKRSARQISHTRHPQVSLSLWIFISFIIIKILARRGAANERRPETF